MELKGNKANAGNVEISEIIKKAYEKGLTKDDLTIDQLMNDLKADLKKMMI